MKEYDASDDSRIMLTDRYAKSTSFKVFVAPVTCSTKRGTAQCGRDERAILGMTGSRINSN